MRPVSFWSSPSWEQVFHPWTPFLSAPSFRCFLCQLHLCLHGFLFTSKVIPFTSFPAIVLFPFFSFVEQLLGKKGIEVRCLRLLVLVIYCFIINYSKIQSLETVISILFCSLYGQEFGSKVAGWFWLRESHEIAVKRSAGKQLFEGLTGTAGTASMVTDLKTGRLLLDVGWKPYSHRPLHRLTEGPHDLVTSFSEGEWFTRARQK